MLLDDISVEDDGGGPVIVFSNGSEDLFVRLISTPDGVRSLTVEQPDPARGGGSGENGAVRRHVRAIEDLARAEFPDALRQFDEERFSDSFLERTTSEERLELLQEIARAARSADGVAVDSDGSGYRVRLMGMVSWDVSFGVESDAPCARSGQMSFTCTIRSGWAPWACSWPGY